MSKLQELIETVSFLTGKPSRDVEDAIADSELGSDMLVQDPPRVERPLDPAKGDKDSDV